MPPMRAPGSAGSERDRHVGQRLGVVAAAVECERGTGGGQGHEHGRGDRDDDDMAEDEVFHYGCSEGLGIASEPIFRACAPGSLTWIKRRSGGSRDSGSRLPPLLQVWQQPT